MGIYLGSQILNGPGELLCSDKINRTKNEVS